MIIPVNLLTYPEPQVYSENKRAEKLMNLRVDPNVARLVIPIDEPCELGFKCPICEYEVAVDGEYDERLAWSTYKAFMWCCVCNKDYPSVLCMPDVDKATDIFLSCISDAKNGFYDKVG